MTELLTAAQMKAIEQAAINSGEVTGLELMERAGRGVVEAIFEEWPEFEGRGGAAPLDPPEYLDKEEKLRAVVLCGPGNNGGDGFVVARLLKERGWEVAVFLYGDLKKLPVDAQVNCERWLEMGEVKPFADVPETGNSVDLIVDALFGTGLKRPLKGELYDWAVGSVCDFEARDKTVAVDMPSGLCSDSGRELEQHTETAVAALTVTFHRPKLGHMLAIGPVKCGRRIVKDIGLGGSMGRGSKVCVSANQAEKRELSKDKSHKYSYGHTLILSGFPGHGGAARLAARGALRIGAGLATVGCPADAIPEHAAQLNAIMLAGVEDGAGLSRVLEDGRINALCLGPGLGTARANELVPVALKSGRKCVLDADALSIYENRDEELFELCHDGVVMTPHGGEFKRLFPDIAEKLAAQPMKGPAYSKVDATRAAAERAGCVVLFKGADTVIAAPDGRCSVNSANYERSAPWLATAGSGDVLAGFIAGLLARGFEPLEAAETAAWLHVECALSFGPGLIAEDLPEELPKVFRQLGL